MGIEFNPEAKGNYSFSDKKTGTKKQMQKLPTSADIRDAMKKLAEKSGTTNNSGNPVITLTSGNTYVISEVGTDMNGNPCKSNLTNTSEKQRISLTDSNTVTTKLNLDNATNINMTKERQVPIRPSTPNDKRLNAPDNYWMWMNGCYGENDKVLSQDGNITNLKTVEQTEDGPENIYYKVTKNEDGTTLIHMLKRELPDGSVIDYKDSNYREYDTKTGKQISSRFGNRKLVYDPNGKCHRETVK